MKMKIDKVKLIKSAVVLAALFIIVIGMTKLIGHNSLTLTEYAQQNPQLANLKETESTKTEDNSMATTDENLVDKDFGDEDSLDEDSLDEPFGNEASLDKNSDNKDSVNSNIEISALETANSTEEPLQNQQKPVSTSTLTGAILNADSMEELRITYANSFYYEPLSDNLKRYITGVSFPAISQTITDTAFSSDTFKETGVNTTSTDVFVAEELAISYDELRYVHILHYDFDGNLTEGELICNEWIAQDLVEIFYALYRNEYQLEKVRLIDEYDGDDTASMEDNNTSCFNYRVVQGSTSLSKHALGLAIDINPLYNPYITYNDDGTENVSPTNASAYADRTASFPYKIDENDLCYKLFIEHGFTWGGNWNSSKDYQHFQKVPAQ